MSMDQNEPQAPQGHVGFPPVVVSAPQDGAQAGTQGSPATSNREGQRRRRRRRKGGKPALASGTPPEESKTAEGRTAGAAGPAPAASGESAPEQSRREGRPPQPEGRQAQNGPGSNHGKKNGRPQKGGGGQNGSQQREGRHFSKAGGSGSQQPREYNPGNGTGPQGGGARRKNKVRRQAPSFVGPMDHSYRTVNGNVADGPPSTMDFRSNGNGNGNISTSGRSGYNGYLDSSEAVVPVIIRDDAPSRILCFIEDLFVVAKMQETARKLGVKVSFIKAEKDIVTRLTETPDAERPSLIVFDLNNANAKPLTLIPKLKAKLKRGTSVIGFLSHIQGDLKAKAIEAGCDMVMPKSAFSQNLPNLLRRHGLDEELEAVEV